MKYTPNIDYKAFCNEIDTILKGTHAEEETSSDGGKTWVITTAEATLEIIINYKWVGYDLTVRSPLIGHTIGANVDTDLYPLKAGNEAITLEIFNEVKECLKGLIDRQIYIGILRKRPFLAIPISKDEFTAKSYKFRERWWQLYSAIIETEDMSRSELLKLDGVRAIK